LRFRGEYARFSDLSEENIAPHPGEDMEVIQSKLNNSGRMSGNEQFDSITDDMIPIDRSPF
jgi:hypothetical protein